MSKARKFDINNLPNDVWGKVASITWNNFYEEDFEENGEDAILGYADIEDGYVYEEESKLIAFTSRKDLIQEVRISVREDK